MKFKEAWAWACVEKPLVQILVVVATKKVEFFLTDEEKGF